jgi:hypothetical protein
LALAPARAGVPNVVVFELTQVTTPPAANVETGRGMEAPPVAAVPEHPLMVTVPVTVPFMAVHVTLPLGPAAAHA